MLQKQKISRLQAIYLTFASAYGGVFFYHSYIISLAGRSAWIAEFLSGFINIVLALWVLSIAKKHPGRNIFQILELFGGKWISTIFITAYVALNIVLSSLLLMMCGGLVKTIALHNTPVWVPMLLIIVLSYLIAGSGIENIARLSAMLEFGILGLMFFPVLLIGVITQFDPGYIFPMLDTDVPSFLKAVLLTGGGHSEFILFLFIMVESLHKPGKQFSSLTIGLLISVVLMPGVGTFLLSAAISPEEASRVAFAGVNIAFSITIGTFIQGIEIFIFIPYVIITVLKLAGNFYSSWVASESVRQRNSKVLIIIITTAVFVITLSLRSFNQAFFYYIQVIQYCVYPFYIVALCTVSILMVARGKKAVSRLT
ncbi:GerAB/ArcD/ProY family transporter [Paenibacillus sp. BC26]|uniref:GerAB/ArcD/ProY family transporter n=1 Tax=Paenibacillus sp. BC26 TaxID=1881032 RepID=UPI0008E2D495|nr:GerAB/ArcD/ProY family transporter [Paenibacillus sp. BC26]SFT13342.1 spore germination protein (amino acid permease) [Paenibacillus sp. BC26]